MPRFRGLEAPLECNWGGLVANLRREIRRLRQTVGESEERQG